MKKIKLTQGKKALIDNDDYEKINQYKWCFDKSKYGGYAMRKNSQGKTIRMHVMILGESQGKIIDHIDDNKLNNQKSNLRFTTRSINFHKSDKLKGFYFDRKRNRFRARITLNGKKICLGDYANKKDAITAYKNYKKENIK